MGNGPAQDNTEPIGRRVILRGAQANYWFGEGSAGMTEAEWTHCTDPAAMLVALRGVATDQALRKFCAACCRRIWGLLSDERSRRAVEMAERLVAGAASESELAAARRGATAAWTKAKAAEKAAEARVYNAFDAVVWQVAEMFATAADAARWACAADVARAAAKVAETAAEAAAIAALNDYQDTEAAQVGERRALCDLLRQLVGNPFRRGAQESAG